LRADVKKPGLTLGSIVCSAPRQDWCVPLRLFYQLPVFDDFNLPSDGMIERDTQSFGDVTAELNIDHFRQIGLFGGSHRFQQLCDVLVDFFTRADTGGKPARTDH
jgi:hypothetical protein